MPKNCLRNLSELTLAVVSEQNTTASRSRVKELCLRCGLCCNGVIFADVDLESAREVARIRRAGLGVVTPAGGAASKVASFKLTQPCAALDGCSCRIYPERPASCRAFECLLFKSVEAGRLKYSAALEVIDNARSRVEVVRDLLRKLGNGEETLPIKTRFQNVSRRIEASRPDKVKAHIYSELTLAFHELNRLLRDAFYR